MNIKIKTPPLYGEFDGPIRYPLQWNKSSSEIGDAEQFVGACFSKSFNSLYILFDAVPPNTYLISLPTFSFPV